MGDKVYKINTSIKVIFHALGGETGITDLSMIVYDPSDNASSPVTLSEIGNGLYESSFTPDETGRWWVKITSATLPENAIKESYLVGDQEGTIGVIIQDDEGNKADVTATGRLKVSQEPPEPPTGTTAVTQSEYGNVSTIDDLEYLIPNGETIYLQRFVAGAEQTNGGSVVELWYDPNGNGTNMTIIDTIFCNGTSDQHDLNESFVGDGTKKLRLRRRRLSGGAVLIFGRWEGYY